MASSANVDITLLIKVGCNRQTMMQPTLNSAPVSLRRSVYNFLLNDQQSEGARSSLDRFLFLLILLNLFALLLESAPVLAAEHAKAFY